MIDQLEMPFVKELDLLQKIDAEIARFIKIARLRPCKDDLHYKPTHILLGPSSWKEFKSLPYRASMLTYRGLPVIPVIAEPYIAVGFIP